MRQAPNGKFISTTSAEEDALMIELYETMGVVPIARQIGRSHSFVINRLKTLGVEIRPPGQPPEWKQHLTGAVADARRTLTGSPSRVSYKEMEITRRLYVEEELTCGEIADLMNVALTTVVWRLQRFGVPRRSRSEALRLHYKRARERQKPRLKAAA